MGHPVLISVILISCFQIQNTQVNNFQKAERGYTLVSDTLTCEYSFLFPQVHKSNLFFFRPGMTESAESTPTPSLILNSYEKPFLEEMQMLAAKNLTTKNEIRDAVWCCLSRIGPYLYRLDYYKQRVHVGCWGRRSRNWVLGWLRFRDIPAQTGLWNLVKAADKLEYQNPSQL